MAEPFDPDRKAGQGPSPDPVPDPPPGPGSPDHDVGEDDLDIDVLASVWRDDLLLDAIGDSCGRSDLLDVPFDISADRQLVEALLEWRRDVGADPPVLLEPDPEAAAATGPGGGRRRYRFRVPLVSSLAAVVVIVLTALAAYGATPDEVLWPVTEVLYSQHAESVRAASDADAAQAQAEAAIASGNGPAAEAALHTAARRIPQVHNQDGRTELQDRQRELEKQLNTAPGPAPRTSAPESGTPSRSPKTPAAVRSTSEAPTHSPRRSDIPSARDADAHGSVQREAPDQRTSSIAQSTSVPPPSRPRSEQSAEPPRPTRSNSAPTTRADAGEIGRASCRERV